MKTDNDRSDFQKMLDAAIRELIRKGRDNGDMVQYTCRDKDYT